MKMAFDDLNYTSLQLLSEMMILHFQYKDRYDKSSKIIYLKVANNL